MANQITVNVRQISATTSEAAARQHLTLIDRPEAKGGTDRGAMGGEYLLIALGGCFMSGLLEVIRTREAQISDVSVEVVGTLESAPSRYGAIAMHVTARYTDAEQFHRFVEMAERACIVSNTLKSSIPITVSVSALSTNA
jgi:putative redox protein